MRTENCQPVFFVHHVPPCLDDVKSYFIQKGVPHAEAEDFYHVYENRHWISRTGNFIKNWKVVAFRWIATLLKTPLPYSVDPQ